VQHHAADQLRVEGALANRPACRLPDRGERLGQEVVELLAFREALSVLWR